MKNFFKDNWFKLVISLAILLVCISIFYYFVIFIPQKERAKMEQQEKVKQEEQAKELSKKELFDNCMQEVEDNFRRNSMGLCSSMGYTQEQIDNLECQVRNDVVKKMEDEQKAGQDRCFKNYHQ